MALPALDHDLSLAQRVEDLSIEKLVPLGHLGDAVALRNQDIDLAQLGEDLLGRVSLPRNHGPPQD